MPDTLLASTCAGCGINDDHPKHTFARVSTGPVSPPPLPWHFDCHALTGCPVCIDMLVECGTDPSPDGLKGAALRERLAELRNQRDQEE